MAILKNGSRGEEVKVLQRLLTVAGFPVKDDGAFGNDTETAVREFQKSANIGVDGKVGNGTMAALQARAGKGSVLNSIPMPLTNRSRAAAMPTLEAVGQIVGVDPVTLATFCSIESSFDWTIKAKTSSATGWFQQLNKTWDDSITLFGAKHGIFSDPDRKLRTDPRANALFGAELLAENISILGKKLRRQPTDTELYAAHFFGPSTAAQFLSANESQYGAELFPRQAAANEGIFYDRGKKALTIAQIKALLEKKVSEHRK